MQALAWLQPATGYQAPANSQNIPPNSLQAVTLEFGYDGLSRRVMKKTTIGTGSPELEGYHYDGWNVIMISKLNSDGSHNFRKWSCVWRPDIGSSLSSRTDWQKAGGVGGLAWMQTGGPQDLYHEGWGDYGYGMGNAEIHVPMMDHMGNVRHYFQIKFVDGLPTGMPSANFEYDAFGREVRAWGANTPAGPPGQPEPPPGIPASTPWVDQLPFHFSTKFTDADSGLNYYGYRFYDPLNGRWLNRDPIGERGGVNLSRMLRNNCPLALDWLGLAETAYPNNGTVCNKCDHSVYVLINRVYYILNPGQCTPNQEAACVDVDGVWVNGKFHTVGKFGMFSGVFNACEDSNPENDPPVRGAPGTDDPTGGDWPNIEDAPVVRAQQRDWKPPQRWYGF